MAGANEWIISFIIVYVYSLLFLVESQLVREQERKKLEFNPKTNSQDLAYISNKNY
jgi:hypothetical protein